MSVPFKIHVLGSSAAIPTSTRFTTAQLVNYRNRHFLLDCAEGTQIQLRRQHLPFLKIDHIFISHLHGDHFLGLPGLIFTMHLLGRKKRLHVYAPEGIKEIIELQYKITQLEPGFRVEYHLISDAGQLLYEDSFISIETIGMIHRLPSYGFLFREKPPLLNIKKEAIELYDISFAEIQKIKMGNDLELPSGDLIPNKELTLPPVKARSYAFCSDTVYTDSYIHQIRNVDLLYHEATFLHDRADIALEKTHCTALQAATIAQKAEVKQLMIGHFSARYDELSLFTDEAKTVFNNTILAEEGTIVEIEQVKLAINNSEEQSQD
jgi:ribonuclease Z